MINAYSKIQRFVLKNSLRKALRTSEYCFIDPKLKNTSERFNYLLPEWRKNYPELEYYFDDVKIIKLNHTDSEKAISEIIQSINGCPLKKINADDFMDSYLKKNPEVERLFLFFLIYNDCRIINSYNKKNQWFIELV